MIFTPTPILLKDDKRLQVAIHRDDSDEWASLVESLGISRSYIATNVPKVFRLLDEMSEKVPEVENLLRQFILEGAEQSES